MSAEPIAASPGAVEDIEGMDVPSALGDYPIDTLLIRHETRTVHDVLRRMELGQYVLDPDFQRDFIWDKEKQSRLIESVLMRIPLPVFYLAEDEKGDMVVVDGLQRLSTFRSFVSGTLRLSLKDRDDLNGKRFADLPAKLQNRIEDCNLVIYAIDAKVQQRAKLDIFERVNGGVALTRQQMRNCMFMGPATAFLKAQAASQLFKDATGRSLRTDTMRDREFVNRYCAFALLPLDDYRGDMDEFLAGALRIMNKQSDDELERLGDDLQVSLANNQAVFGEHAFRKSRTGERRSPINAALWDVLSTGLAKYRYEAVQPRADALRAGLHDLLTDADFARATTLGTNQRDHVYERFELAQAMLEEVLGA